VASLFVLGGSTPEYNACPASTIRNHFFDGAIDPIGHTSSVSTNLVLVPCSEDLVAVLPAAPRCSTPSTTSSKSGAR
jgi:hypothetical protein